MKDFQKSQAYFISFAGVCIWCQQKSSPCFLPKEDDGSLPGDRATEPPFQKHRLRLLLVRTQVRLLFQRQPVLESGDRRGQTAASVAPVQWRVPEAANLREVVWRLWRPRLHPEYVMKKTGKCREPDFSSKRKSQTFSSSKRIGLSWNPWEKHYLNFGKKKKSNSQAKKNNLPNNFTDF